MLRDPRGGRRQSQVEKERPDEARKGAYQKK